MRERNPCIRRPRQVENQTARQCLVEGAAESYSELRFDHRRLQDLHHLFSMRTNSIYAGSYLSILEKISAYLDFPKIRAIPGLGEGHPRGLPYALNAKGSFFFFESAFIFRNSNLRSGARRGRAAERTHTKGEHKG